MIRSGQRTKQENNAALNYAISTIRRYQVGFSRTPNIFNRDGSSSFFTPSNNADHPLTKTCMEAWRVVCDAVKGGELSVDELFEKIGHPITDKDALRQLGLEDGKISAILRKYNDDRLALLQKEHERLASIDYGRNNG